MERQAVRIRSKVEYWSYSVSHVCHSLSLLSADAETRGSAQRNVDESHLSIGVGGQRGAQGSGPGLESPSTASVCAE